MGRISALTELTSLASDDYIVVLDSSANIAKKITIANAFGLVDFGWTTTGESWTYSAWSSTTRIGEITVPTDATVKYIAGMRVKITQSTGGTKYGIIHKVEATKLHIFFGQLYTLNNEAITSPQYSIAYIPLGFPLNDKNTDWSVELNDTTQHTQGSAVDNTWYNLGSLSLSVGVGDWILEYTGIFLVTPATVSTASYPVVESCLSTANNTSYDDELKCSFGGNNTGQITSWQARNKEITLSSAQTFYLNVRTIAGGSTGAKSIYTSGSLNKTVVRATSRYV